MRTRALLIAGTITLGCLAPTADVDARHRPRVAVPSQVVISSVAPNGLVSGVVSASKAACADERKVAVTRNGAMLPTTQTDSSGDWTTSSARPTVGDRFTAEIARERVRVGNRIYVCGSDFDSFVFNG